MRYIGVPLESQFPVKSFILPTEGKGKPVRGCLNQRERQMIDFTEASWHKTAKLRDSGDTAHPTNKIMLTGSILYVLIQKCRTNT